MRPEHSFLSGIESGAAAKVGDLAGSLQWLLKQRSSAEGNPAMPTAQPGFSAWAIRQDSDMDYDRWAGC